MTRRRGPEDGMVTAEFAVALPAVVLVLAVALGGLRLAVEEIRCEDAARVGARSAARGDAPADVVAAAERAAPAGATVTVQRVGSDVTVTVVASPILPIDAALLPLPVASARASAHDESAAPDGSAP